MIVPPNLPYIFYQPHNSYNKRNLLYMILGSYSCSFSYNLKPVSEGSIRNVLENKGSGFLPFEFGYTTNVNQ